MSFSYGVIRGKTIYKLKLDTLTLKSPLKTLKRDFNYSPSFKTKIKRQKQCTKMHQGEYPKRTKTAVEYETTKTNERLPARRVPRRLKAIHFMQPCSKYSSMTSGKSPCNGSSTTPQMVRQ